MADIVNEQNNRTEVPLLISKRSVQSSSSLTNNKLMAIIRVRGDVRARRGISDTMRYLQLYKKNYCVVLPATPSIAGMLQKIKDYATFGEINEQTLNLLVGKRGRLPGNKPLSAEYIKHITHTDPDIFIKEVAEGKKKLKDIAGMKQFFRLTPPKGGFERPGIKKSYSIGGALGYRKDKINELIQRMI